MEMTWIPIVGVVCFLLGIGFGLWVLSERAIAEAVPEPEAVEEQEQDKQLQWEQEFDHIMENAWRNGW